MLRCLQSLVDRLDETPDSLTESQFRLGFDLRVDTYRDEFIAIIIIASLLLPDKSVENKIY